MKYRSVILFLCLLLSGLRAAQAQTATGFAVTVTTGFSTSIQLQGSVPAGSTISYGVGGFGSGCLTCAAPQHGSITNADAATGVVIYTPNAGYTGSDSFQFIVYATPAGGGSPTLSSAATVQLTVTAAKTRVMDVLLNPDGTPRQGTVTFVLTGPASAPGGLIAASASVSATLDSAGRFDLSVYASANLSPQSYYQVWFADKTTLRRELIGVYNIPQTTSIITLAPYKVTDTAKAARFEFAAKADIDALIPAIANQTIGQLLAGSHTVNRLQRYTASGFADSIISDNGTAVTVQGSATVNGAIKALAFTGNGAGLTGITGATGGVGNTGSTTISADNDSDGTGIIDLQTRNQSRLRVNNDGGVDLVGGIARTTRAALPPAGNPGRLAQLSDDNRQTVIDTGYTWAGLGGEFVNVKRFVTGGSGTSDSPWTGWETQVTWQADTTYYFPAGTYGVATAPNWALNGIRIIFENGAVLKHTGSGPAVKVDGGAATTYVQNVTLENLTIQGNAATTYGLYLRAVSRSNFRSLRIRGAATAAVQIEFGVLNTFYDLIASVNYGMSPVPTYGVYLTRRAPGEDTTTQVFLNPTVEGATGWQYYLAYGSNNLIVNGTAEAGANGVYLSDTSNQNIIQNTDIEALTGTGIDLGGRSNVVVDSLVSAPVSVRASALMAALVRGYFTSSITIASGAFNTKLNRIAHSGTLTDSGTSTQREDYTWFNGSTWVSQPDRLKREVRFLSGARVGENSAADIYADADGTASYLRFRDGSGNTKFMFYGLGSTALYLRDVTNSRQHLTVTQGSSAASALTQISSRLLIDESLNLGAATLPPVSASGQVRTAFDSADNKYKFSENAGSYRYFGKYLTTATTWDPPSLADGAVASTTVTVTGAAAGDACSAGHDQLGSNLVMLSCHVQGADTARVTVLNKTGGALDLGSGTLRVFVWKH
ncbi:MAG TPA: right-handed parallel beta-helix repeat-containing protein [Blastocatellia bacterium]|nr:right-handed parallel beta-helix repeat-containing protein [Blastocatellia bacterium]